jgi:cell division septation protein DedD
MKYLFHLEFGRSTVFKCLSVFLALAATHAAFDMDDNAYTDEGTYYSIYLLSFKGIDDARAKVKEFNDLGYNAFCRQEISSDKAKIFNVYIEKFKSRPEAEKSARALKELALISDYDIRGITEKSRSNPPVIKKDTKDIKKAAKEIKKDKNGYFLKVSSLKEQAKADEVVKTLQNAGYHPFYSRESVKGKGDWYRVYLDRYESKEDAEKDGKKLMASGIISGFEIKRSAGIIQSLESIQKDEKKVYSLHVASYKESSHADEDVRRLAEYGLRAVSMKTEISGEQWFRVYIGEFSDEKEAREKGAELIGKGVITYFKPMIIDKTSE